MKFLAVLLIGCLLFLSSFPGMANAAANTAKMDCCKKMTAKDACQQKSAKNKAGGCGKPGCAMLFSCSICGFIPVAPLGLPSNVSLNLNQPVPLYKAGDLSGYQKADWKPPKAC